MSKYSVYRYGDGKGVVVGIGKLKGIYKLFSKSNNLLYVGISNNIKTRVNTHLRKNNWQEDIAYVVVEEISDKTEYLKREREIIELEYPFYNKTYNYPDFTIVTGISCSL